MLFTPSKKNPPSEFSPIHSPVTLSGDVIAIVGKNGSGKTKFLQSIINREIEVTTEKKIIENIVFIKINEIQPMLDFNINADQIKSKTKQAYLIYENNRAIFKENQATIYSYLSKLSNQSTALLPNIYMAVKNGAEKNMKDRDSLSEEEFLDYFSQSEHSSIGTLKINELIYEYMERLEKNKYNKFKNIEYSQNLKTYTDEEFLLKFGRPPSDTLNEALNLVLDGLYKFPEPDIENKKFQFSLKRNDGTSISPLNLSSGEKTLLWLSLCLYPTNSDEKGYIPELLLLDEPDSTLHPGMLQKFHEILKLITKNFNCKIIYTTHSPTTIALSESNDIYTKTARGLTRTSDKDEIIADLLSGVNQIAINYSNKRQVYVESFKDCKIYEELFLILKKAKRISSSFISLSFMAATPRYPVKFIECEAKKFFPKEDPNSIRNFTESLNGQGNSAQVIGTVEQLIEQGNLSVHGIVDWDLKNKPKMNIHVHALDTFYTMENAILNPLILGLYLLNFHPQKSPPGYFELDHDIEVLSLFDNTENWQNISDAVTRKVLKVTNVNHDVACDFINGKTVFFDKRYVHENGHDLEEKLKSNDTFPFLRSLNNKSDLTLDVIIKSIKNCNGRTMPVTFLHLFNDIQENKSN